MGKKGKGKGECREGLIFFPMERGKMLFFPRERNPSGEEGKGKKGKGKGKGRDGLFFFPMERGRLRFFRLEERVGELKRE